MKVDHMKADEPIRQKHAIKDDEEIEIVNGSGPDNEEIAQLAYALWEERGCPEGCPEDDWFRAEQMLRNRAR